MPLSIARALIVLSLVSAPSALWTAAAAAQPGIGPRETIDQQFTTKKPNSPTGLTFSASFHGAGDENARPPFMRRLVIHPPPGMVYDTSVPNQCGASDLQLQLQGAAACSPGSRLGGGTIEGLILFPFSHDPVFDHFQHPVDILNNANEQIILVNSEGSTVVRAQFQPDGSLDLESPACFPVPPTGCVDDYIVELNSSTAVAPYTRGSGGQTRSYATTPPTCPKRGYWKTTVDVWWEDGSVDRVVSKEPCARQKHRQRHRPRHRP